MHEDYFKCYEQEWTEQEDQEFEALNLKLNELQLVYAEHQRPHEYTYSEKQIAANYNGNCPKFKSNIKW